MCYTRMCESEFYFQTIFTWNTAWANRPPSFKCSFFFAGPVPRVSDVIRNNISNSCSLLKLRHEFELLRIMIRLEKKHKKHRKIFPKKQNSSFSSYNHCTEALRHTLEFLKSSHALAELQELHTSDEFRSRSTSKSILKLALELPSTLRLFESVL